MTTQRLSHHRAFGGTPSFHQGDAFIATLAADRLAFHAAARKATP
jgi:hypothetical protein